MSKQQRLKKFAADVKERRDEIILVSLIAGVVFGLPAGVIVKTIGNNFLVLITFVGPILSCLAGLLFDIWRGTYNDQD